MDALLHKMMPAEIVKARPAEYHRLPEDATILFADLTPPFRFGYPPA